MTLDSQVPTPPVTVRERGEAFYQMKIQRRKRRVFLVFFVWTLLIVYLITPLSKARFTSIQGQLESLSEAQLYEISGIAPHQFWWEISSLDASQRLQDYRYIADATVTQNLLGLNLAITEIVPVGKYGTDCEGLGTEKSIGGACSFYLSNGQIINGENNLNIYDNRHIRQIDRIPYLTDASSYSTTSFQTLLNQVGMVNLKVRSRVKAIEKNLTYTQFEAINFVFDATLSSLDQDLTIIVDLDHLSEKITPIRVDYLLNIVQTNGEAYRLPSNEYCIVNVDGNTAIPCAS